MVCVIIYYGNCAEMTFYLKTTVSTGAFLQCLEAGFGIKGKNVCHRKCGKGIIYIVDSDYT